MRVSVMFLLVCSISGLDAIRALTQYPHEVVVKMYDPEMNEYNSIALGSFVVPEFILTVILKTDLHIDMRFIHVVTSGGGDTDIAQLAFLMQYESLVLLGVNPALLPAETTAIPLPPKGWTAKVDSTARIAVLDDRPEGEKRLKIALADATDIGVYMESVIKDISPGSSFLQRGRLIGLRMVNGHCFAAATDAPIRAYLNKLLKELNVGTPPDAEEFPIRS